MTTIYKKCKYTGWAGVTEIDLPEIPDRPDHSGRFTKPVLEIRTTGKNGIVSSFVSVGWSGDGFISHAIALGTGGDYAKRLNCSPCSRVTEKAVFNVHETTLSQLEAIKTEAIAHYQNRMS